jgi:hypothetical protein
MISILYYVRIGSNRSGTSIQMYVWHNCSRYVSSRMWLYVSWMKMCYGWLETSFNNFQWTCGYGSDCTSNTKNIKRYHYYLKIKKSTCTVYVPIHFCLISLRFDFFQRNFIKYTYPIVFVQNICFLHLCIKLYYNDKLDQSNDCWDLTFKEIFFSVSPVRAKNFFGRSQISTRLNKNVSVHTGYMYSS